LKNQEDDSTQPPWRQEKYFQIRAFSSPAGLFLMQIRMKIYTIKNEQPNNFFCCVLTVYEVGCGYHTS
jgi:hypothetical protein